jgi:hypothetical protein
MLGAVGEKACLAVERLAANGQSDSRRFLYIAHPLTIHVRDSDIDLVTVYDKPNCDLVGFPGPATVMRQRQGLPSRYPLQSRHFVPILLDTLEYVYDRLHFSPSLALLLPLGSRPAQGRLARSRRSALGRSRSARAGSTMSGDPQPAFAARGGTESPRIVCCAVVS